MRVVAWKPAQRPSRLLPGLLLGFALVILLAIRLLPAAAATFTVTNTADSGPGSLRQAIEAANAAPGADAILFRIPISDPGFAGGVFTIRPTSQLPTIEGPTVLDGYSQTGFTGNSNPTGPEIVLNGALAGDASGLDLSGSNSVIRGFVINGFSRSGLLLSGNSNRVEGCYFGANAAGIAAVPNGEYGIQMFATNGQIGGTDPRSRNVISGNTRSGIFSGGGNGNVVAGNFIGVNAAGTAAIPNGELGVFLQNAFDNRIGGTAAGSRNLISGNQAGGVELESGNNNRVQGNYIGTDVRGELAIPNQGRGVTVTQTSGTLVGGTASAARNVISGNLGSGVQLVHTGADRVQGNYIGLNAVGTAALPNGGSGVELLDDGGYLVGGAEAGARNVISGNGGNGVSILLDSTNNLIQGNYIGTNPVGRVSIPNGGHGVWIADGAQANQVGGTTTGARNLISGNAQDGVQISGESVFDQLPPPTAFNVVQGNFIGTDYSGDRALPNGQGGVSLVEGAMRNTIGGTTTGARNLISGNLRNGVTIVNSETQDNSVMGNFIGVNLGGVVAVPNGQHGVEIGDAATNRIGGPTTGERNLISGNQEAGVYLNDAGIGNRVEGNYIGTNVSGSGAVPNRLGVALFFTNDTVIGGSVTGAGNLISGNRFAGVVGEDSARIAIQGNFIGTNALGSAALPNRIGISLGQSSDIRIGGVVPAERNVISGNLGNGVALGPVDNTRLQGNYIGVNAAGAVAVPNTEHGVGIFDRARFTTIGDADPGSRNVISGNRADGVFITEGSEATTLQGNYLGTNAAGTLAVPNGRHGVEIFQSEGNRIGGPAAGAGNVISGNGGNGVLIGAFGFDAIQGNLIQGNLIGTRAAGAGPLPNRGHGVALQGEALQDNRIGGIGPGEGNQIAYNLGDGVLFTSTAEDDPTLFGNPIRANSIHDNQGLGINLRPPGEPPGTVTPNDFQDPDPGPNRLQNFPVLTSAVVQSGLTTITGTLNSAPNSSFALDFFHSPAPDPSGFGEGQAYLGSTTVLTDASGNASFTFVAAGAGAGAPGYFTATATNTATQDTGEFSPALAGSSPPPAQPGFGPRRFAFGPGRAPGSGSLAGRVTDHAGSGIAGVRISLHQHVTGQQIYSRDWDPNRLQVAWTDEDGAIRFSGLAPGRYLVLAYAPGVFFALRAQWVDVGLTATSLSFKAAGTDDQEPQVSITTPTAGSQGTGPAEARGTVSDPGGSGVRAVLVRLYLQDREPGQPKRCLDWRTGAWELKSAPGQSRWASLDAAGAGWKLDLPSLAAGSYQLEVQAYDWAGRAGALTRSHFAIP